MSEKLLPCPFCGGEADLTDLLARKGRRDPEGMWFVQCDDCGATFPHFDTEPEAITAWNRRTETDHIPDTTKMVPLTMNDLISMDGEPIFAIDGEGHQCWVVVNTGDECCADSEFGSWQFINYGMKDCTTERLHPMGWIAYRSKPAE